mmetsp:Transcript_8593/g.19250  ORF Transcript_8593/g.19250 Transcript_8593/m.19250 type:complete len:328 (+) Transcript_8593:110-1093(+)
MSDNSSVSGQARSNLHSMRSRTRTDIPIPDALLQSLDQLEREGDVSSMGSVGSGVDSIPASLTVTIKGMNSGSGRLRSTSPHRKTPLTPLSPNKRLLADDIFKAALHGESVSDPVGFLIAAEMPKGRAHALPFKKPQLMLMPMPEGLPNMHPPHRDNRVLNPFEVRPREKKRRGKPETHGVDLEASAGASVASLTSAMSDASVRGAGTDMLYLGNSSSLLFKEGSVSKHGPSSSLAMSLSMSAIPRAAPARPVPWLPRGTLQPPDHDRSNRVLGLQDKVALQKHVLVASSLPDVVVTRSQAAIRQAFEEYALKYAVALEAAEAAMRE